MDLLTHITPYHWFALGLILLGAEMLGAAGFLIGAGIAALAMGVIVWLAPELPLTAQVLTYAFAAGVATLSYFHVLKDMRRREADFGLNDVAHRLLGHQFTLDVDLEAGLGKLQIGDTLWKVSSAAPLSKGTRVTVVDTDVQTLTIAPSGSEHSAATLNATHA
ncbi:MAG: NfeD family protein [Pseudomonadota bacterium]